MYVVFIHTQDNFTFTFKCIAAFCISLYVDLEVAIEAFCIFPVFNLNLCTVLFF